MPVMSLLNSLRSGRSGRSGRSVGLVYVTGFALGGTSFFTSQIAMRLGIPTFFELGLALPEIFSSDKSGMSALDLKSALGEFHIQILKTFFECSEQAVLDILALPIDQRYEIAAQKIFGAKEGSQIVIDKFPRYANYLQTLDAKVNAPICFIARDPRGVAASRISHAVRVRKISIDEAIDGFNVEMFIKEYGDCCAQAKALLASGRNPFFLLSFEKIVANIDVTMNRLITSLQKVLPAYEMDKASTYMAGSKKVRQGVEQSTVQNYEKILPPEMHKSIYKKLEREAKFFSTEYSERLRR